MPILIVAERPDTVEATTLIRELDGYPEPLYPQEGRHGLSVDQLSCARPSPFLLCVMRRFQPGVEASNCLAQRTEQSSAGTCGPSFAG
jgi:hypothetical protein